MTDARPIRVVVVHRGDPPRLTPDPWAPEPQPPGRADAGEGLARVPSRIVQLARAIAASPGWLERPTARLFVRESPEPVIAAVGRFDAADTRWLEGASEQLAVTLPRVRWLDAAAVASACDLLAATLTDRFGAASARGFRYAAVPRGGLIVLGTLAYRLGLPHERLLPREAERDGDDVPLVIVDDIAISGLRLSSFVDRHPETRLVVATLYAHPELRAAFLARHSRVEAFIAAHDLHDHAPTTYGADYEAWRERWRARVAPGTVWVGQTERVLFPWGEPDAGVWNDALQREEAGWSLVPPERVLKRRVHAPIPVHRMPVASGPLTPTEDVVAGEFEGSVVIGHLGSGHTYALDGVAAETWRALIATGDVAAAAARLGETFAGPTDRIRDATASFAADLVAAGVLTGTTA